ncbi:MAG TPA: glycogen/starch/alpha-glucan phosphorylase, partial [Treponemataceae bacterium]|nr:glycogen/starch/alpha-glucan phosphorylase [Treponemataceae bacterium]
NAEEVETLTRTNYDPLQYYYANRELKQVIDQIRRGHFSPENVDLFKPLVDSLLYQGDQYLLLADYQSYIACQDRVSQAFRDTESWTRMSILNTARMGKFSTDRTISEYSQDIWGIEPVHIGLS